MHFIRMWDLSIFRVELYANDEKVIPILDRQNVLPQVRHPDGGFVSYDVYPTPTIRAETVNLAPLGTLIGLTATWHLEACDEIDSGERKRKYPRFTCKFG